MPAGSACFAVDSEGAGLRSGPRAATAAAYRFHGSETAASRLVPKRIEGEYHQLVTPSTRGNRPAEMAGAIGERIVRRIASDASTVRKTATKPVRAGVAASISGASAQRPRGLSITSHERADSSGKSM